MSNDAFREELAALIHKNWSDWMKYMFSKGNYVGSDRAFLVPPWAVERWERQMSTTYQDLPEEEKATDREEADKILALIYASLSRTFDPHDSIDL